MATCDGCEPDEKSFPPTIVIGGGNPQPAQTVAQAHATRNPSAITMKPDGSTELNPAAFPPGTSPALLEVLNQLRSVRIEVAAVLTVLEKRGLVTMTELQEARVAVNQAAQKAFEMQQAQLGRDFIQRPTTYPPRPQADARRPQ